MPGNGNYPINIAAHLVDHVAGIQRSKILCRDGEFKNEDQELALMLAQEALQVAEDKAREAYKLLGGTRYWLGG